MKRIILEGVPLEVKDYLCADSRYPDSYLPKWKQALWLYVNVTDRCNARCPFCVAGAKPELRHQVEPEKFFNMLDKIKDHVYGISFTGGEPALDLDLLGTLVEGTVDRVGDEIELDMVTNGINLQTLSQMPWIRYFTSIHISRHAIDDGENRRILGFPAPSSEEIAAFVASLRDPGKVVLNCVMQKGGVSTMEQVCTYLDHAIQMRVRKTSFITMFRANEYCSRHFVCGADFPVMKETELEAWNRDCPERKISILNRQQDHSFCRCASGVYASPEDSTLFYFRCPGKDAAPDYCRQLVYTAENQLQDGFGSGRTVILSADSL